MNKQGFITIYGIMLLNLILPFSMMLIEQAKTSYLYHQDRTLDFVEIQAINKVKRELLAYEEENQTYSFLDYEIALVYEDITCYIHIYQDATLLLSSILEFDDINEEVVSYTYVK